MATDESARLHLYEQARAAWGDDAAGTLMTALPRDPDRLATSEDVRSLGTDLRGEMTVLNAGLRGEMTVLRAELRGEMADLNADLRGEMTVLNAELRGEMAELRGHVDSKFAEAIRSMQMTIIASNATLVGLVFAATRLT